MGNPLALLEFARIGFINMMAFRLRYYTGIITYFINVTVYYFIWNALFQADPAFASLRFEEMLTYVSIGWVMRSVYFNNIDVQLSQEILEGKITAALLKPVDLQASIVARAAGEALFRLLMLALPAGLLLFAVYPLLPPAGPEALLLFLAAMLGSILLVAAINFIVGAFAVKMKSILGLLRAKFYLMDLLSGLIVPMTLFPAPLREVSAWLPFEHIGYTPLMIYLGRSAGPAAWAALGVTYLWVLLLLAGGWWFWRWMMRGITIHGG